MCSKQKFFVCKHCGNLIGMIENKGVPMICCGEKMNELIPNTVEASVEKHLPVISAIGNKIEVAIGSISHPMEEAHHIDFVYVETECGGQRKCLKIGDTPRAVFSFEEDKPIAVYAYCNLHGLWKTEIK
ncbi:desulfoferrodoxin family protein [Acetivibrio cellulolyticus]|uniref:desulfoferrodoxin family protein n=1 Tax=Acetivibrio cellulolyticus TaxID=35830 RepID=UPI0001E2EB7A|nr:desulfoferrodoxin family protein [Acetivibrio cellulolyticus]